MPSPSSRLPARLVVVLTSLFLLLLAIHFAGVALTRYLVEKNLHPALPRGTSIGEVHLNLITGVLEIEDFRLQRDDELWIRAGRATLDISPWRLLAGRLHIETLDVANAYLRVDRLPGDDGFDFGLPPFGNDEPVDDSGEPMALTLDGATIERFSIEYRDGELTSLFYIDSFEVGAYSLIAQQQTTKVNWRTHWDGRLLAGEAEIEFDGGQFAVDGQLQTDPLDLAQALRLARLPESTGGELAYDGAFSWQSSTLALNGGLRVPSLAYADDGQQLELDVLELPAFALSLQTGPVMNADLALEQPLRVAGLRWQAAEQGAEGKGLVFSSRLSFSLGGELVLNATELVADQLAWRDSARALALTALELDGDLQQALAGGLPRLAADAKAGSLSLRDEGADLELAIDGVRVEGLRLAEVENDTQQRNLSGRIGLAQSRLVSGDARLAWDSVELAAEGLLAADETRIGGDLALSGLKVEHPVLGQPLQLNELVTEGLELGEQTRFAALRLEGLDLASTSPETALTVGSIRLGQGSYSARQGVAIDEIVIDSLQTGVIRDREGKWRHAMSDGSMAPSTAEQAATKDAEESKPVAWRVGSLQVTGESHVTAADYLNPDMSKPRFAIERLRVGTLSSAAADTDTPFGVTLRPDRFSEFVIDGVVRPLANDFYIKAKGHLQGYGLSMVNGLIANDLGHRFLKGQLDNDFDINIESDRLSMSNALRLIEVEVEALEGKDGPPLATAIALLEDRDGNIKLDVPVDGNLDDPDFRVLGALNPIIMKAVAGTAALAIQPLGSVLLVGGLLADQALKVTFEPALFDAGSVELNPSARDYLGQLSGKLAEKPKLAVRLCGVVVDGERKKDKKGAYLDQEPELLQLAQRRADSVRAYMREQGAGKQQLRTCRPALDNAADGEPRVDIKF